MEITNMIRHNDHIECEVCFDKRPVYIPLMTCGHSQTFCEECIKNWLEKGHPTCPKCRAILPIQNYLQQTNQNHVNIVNASLILEYHPPSILQNIHSSPSSTVDRLVHTVFTCFSIGLFIGLIIYPTLRQF